MNRKVEVLANVQAVVDRTYDLVVAALSDAIKDRGQATIALSGGSTPKPLYEKLASADLPWDQVHLFWGDERYVPADHADSNYRMACLAWIDRVPLPPENVHRMDTSAQDPATAAQQHESILRQFFALDDPAAFPALDVILLGMGDDAHTASLFPETAALQVCDQWITVGNKDDQPRLTFTVPLINSAHTVIFMVAGASKQPALRQVFAAQANPNLYPSRFIAPAGNLWWLLDQAAGEGILS
jgi:6-phosphogluconolactonase